MQEQSISSLACINSPSWDLRIIRTPSDLQDEDDATGSEPRHRTPGRYGPCLSIMFILALIIHQSSCLHVLYNNTMVVEAPTCAGLKEPRKF
jgi:hypothetical protein